MKLSDLVEQNRKFFIYNPSYNMYLFVSNDRTKQKSIFGPTKFSNDYIVEAHPHHHEERNFFTLIPTDKNNHFKIFNPSYKCYLFVSTVNYVEAHPHENEDRNLFEFISNGGSKFKIFNPFYKKFVFVSNDKMGNDNIVEAHPHENEDRNLFEIKLADETVIS